MSTQSWTASFVRKKSAYCLMAHTRPLYNTVGILFHTYSTAQANIYIMTMTFEIGSKSFQTIDYVSSHTKGYY